MSKDFIQSSKFEEILFLIVWQVNKYNVNLSNVGHYAIVTIQINTDINPWFVRIYHWI